MIKEKLDKSFNLDNRKKLCDSLHCSYFLIDDQYILRNKENRFDPCIEVSFEREMVEFLEGKDISEDIIYFNVHTGQKLSKYQSLIKLSDNPTDKEIELVVTKIKELHSITGYKNRFNPFFMIDMYKRGIKSEIDSSFEERVINEAKKLYEKYPLVFSHNKLDKENVLFNDDQAFFVNFEYGGNNITLFDLVSFINENKIIDKEKVFALYGDVDLKDFELIKNLQNILWYYNAKYYYLKTKRSIYKKIAQSYLDEIKKEA